jgi:hypothetical protein
MISIHYGNVDILYFIVGRQRKDHQLDGGHDKDHGKNDLVSEYLLEFLL